MKINSKVFQYIGDALKINQVRECLFEPSTSSPTFLFIDAGNNRPQLEQDWYCRNQSPCRRIENESSKIRPPSIDQRIATVTLDRHWHRFTLEGTKSTRQEPSIWLRHWRSIEYDDVSLSVWHSHLLVILVDIDHTRTWREPDQRWGSTMSQWSTDDWSGGTRSTLGWQTIHSSQTLTKLDLGGNQISSIGAQCLANALKVNRVRPRLLLSRVAR